MANAKTEHSKRQRAETARIATKKARETGTVQMYQVSGQADLIQEQKEFFEKIGPGTYAQKIQNLIDSYMNQLDRKI